MTIEVRPNCPHGEDMAFCLECRRERRNERTPEKGEPPPGWLIWRPGPPTEPGDYRVRDADLKWYVSLRNYDKWYLATLDGWPEGKEIAGPIPEPVEGK